MKQSIFFILLILFAQVQFAQIIFEEGFENNNTNETAPNGWTCDTDGWVAGQGEQNHGRKPHSGDWYAYLKWDSDHWMYQQVELVAGESYVFNIWYKTDGNAGFSMEIKWGAAADPGSMQNDIFPLSEVSNDTYMEFSNSFMCATSGTYFVGIHGIANNTPWYLMVDDIELNTIADYAVELQRLNTDTLINAGDSHDYLFDIENTGLYDDQINLNTNTAWPAEFYNADGSGPISSVNLQAEEIKTIILRQSAPATGVEFGAINETTAFFNSENSTNSSQLIFTSTALTPYQDFPLLEGFETELFPPLGWLNSIENGNKNFERSILGAYPTCIPHDNSEGMAYYNSFSAQADESALLVSPELELSDEEYMVRFWMYRTDNIDNKADKIEVYLSEDMELNNPELIGTIHRTIGMEPLESSNGWFEYAFVFDGNDSNKYIIFRAISDYGWNMYLDDIRIAENLPDTEAPEFVSINNLTQYADLEMPVEIVIRDDSEVTTTMNGIFNVGNGEQGFEIYLAGKSKGDHTYIGNIPAQADQTSGTVKFMMEDIYGNVAETEEFEIYWSGIAPLLEESFEGDFLPAGWTQVMAPYTWFVWSKVNEEDYTDSDGVEYVVTPPHGEFQAMVGWDFQENEQDEWLISPEVLITEAADLSFETFAQIGSYDYDHFVVSIQVNNGPWEEKWNAFYMENHVIQYDETIEIPLDEYVGQSIKVAWRAYNPMFDNLWYSWFIDDVRIEKRTNVGLQAPYHINTLDAMVLQNPFNAELKVKVCNSQTAQTLFKLTDISGKVVLQQYDNEANNQQLHSINTSHLRAGIYICTIVQDGFTVSKRVIKM